MRILLIGEFSGYHKYLKEGLEFYENEVLFVSSGDGFKKIESDVLFKKYGDNLIGKFINSMRNIYLIRRLKGYDVVQFINPLIFDRVINSYLINFLIRNNKKAFLLNAGTDAFFFIDYEKKFRYSPHKDFIKYDIKGENIFKNKKYVEWNKKLVRKVDGVIPIMYEYTLDHEKARKVIPIPINIDNVVRTNGIKRRDRIRIFHGLNSKVGFKGTKYIIEALERIKVEFKHEVEVIVKGNMPYEKYIEFMQTVDINIDQCNSYSYGVNAVLSMSMGIVTMSGCEPECLESFNVVESPVINILPDPEDIYLKIKKLLLNRDTLDDIGKESRDYCEKVHSHKIIAKSFLREWTS